MYWNLKVQNSRRNRIRQT